MIMCCRAKDTKYAHQIFMLLSSIGRCETKTKRRKTKTMIKKNDEEDE